MSKFAMLALSFRGTERVPTQDGVRLDRTVMFDGAAGGLLASDSPLFRGRRTKIDEVLSAVGTTSIMKSLFASMFDDMRVFDVAPPSGRVLVDLDHDGVEGRVAGAYMADHVLVARSGESSVGQVEGDDLLVMVFLHEADPALAEAASQPRHSFSRRFATAQESWNFVSKLGLLPDITANFRSDVPAGVYFISQKRLEEIEGRDDNKDRHRPLKDVVSSAQELDFRRALSAYAAYLYYCWLICQRVERLALSTNVNGDWDVESRKMILARKKLVIGKKYAFVKNRAAPDSPILPYFWNLSAVFRLEEQLNNISEQLDELGKAITAENDYVSSGRLKTIEIIIFISTILGLGVALNAIQMPPFYQADANALGRIEFYVVFLAVILSAVVLMGVIGKRKFLYRLFQRLFSR